MGRGIILFSLLILIFSCESGQGNLQNNREAKFFKPYEFKTIEVPAYPNCFHDPFQIQTDEEGYAIPVSVSPINFSCVGLKISFGFSPDSILFKLFPGNIYRDGCHDVFFTCWISSSDKQKSTGRVYMGDSVYFPDKSGNESRWLDTLYWTQPDGKRYFLFSVSTCNRTTDGCAGMFGRFIPGWLGLALFRAGKSGWELIAFDPAMDLSGQFSCADRPGILVTGFSSFLIQANDHDLGLGSPSRQMQTLFAVKNKKFVTMTEKMNTGVGNRISSWETKISSVDSLSGKPFPDLRMITSGIVYLEDFETVGENCLIPEAAPYFKIKNAFRFERKQLLQFSNGKYLVRKTEFNADTSWLPGN